MELNAIQERALMKIIGELASPEMEKRFQLTDEEQDEIESLYQKLDVVQPYRSTLPR